MLDNIRFGNPTCEFCGKTYHLLSKHDCPMSQDAKIKALTTERDTLAVKLKTANKTLRDQFAMAALQGS